MLPLTKGSASDSSQRTEHRLRHAFSSPEEGARTTLLGITQHAAASPAQRSCHESYRRNYRLSLGEPTSPGAMGRVLLTFSAPRRAFTGLHPGGSWWLPYLLILLVGLGYVGSIGSRVGWEAVSRNNLASSPKQQARFDQASPVQQEQQITIIARLTRTIAFAAPVVSPLLAGAVVAAVLLATFRFGMGAPVSFGSLFAVYMFSALIPALKAVLETSLLLSGVGVESFQINNPLGSNPAFYLQGSALPHPLLAALS